jgi:hypothetical protein
MLVREYTPGDLEALRTLHAAQGFDYAFPDLADPLFVSKLVLEDDAVPQTSVCASSPSSRITQTEASKTTQAKACATRPLIRAAALLRLTCEAYLLLDPRDPEDDAHGASNEDKPDSPAAADRRGRLSYGARDRWARIVALQEAATRDAWSKGLSDVHCWLPPRIARRFGRRLESLGWVRDDSWVPYCKRLTARCP